MRALDKHRIANRHPESEFDILGDDVQVFGDEFDILGDDVQVFGDDEVLGQAEPGTFDKLVSAVSTLAQAAPEIRQGVERTIDPSKARQQQQQYQQLPPSYYQQYQQPKKKGGIPDWAVYSLGAVGVLGLGVVGYKMIKR